MAPRTLASARHYLRALGSAVREARWEPERVRAIALDDCLPEGVRGHAFEAVFHQRNLEEALSRRLWA